MTEQIDNLIDQKYKEAKSLFTKIYNEMLLDPKVQAATNLAMEWQRTDSYRVFKAKGSSATKEFLSEADEVIHDKFKKSIDEARVTEAYERYLFKLRVFKYTTLVVGETRLDTPDCWETNEYLRPYL